MAKTAELESAFDAAITQARKCIKAGMTAVGGEAAGPYLRKLEEELKLERARALERGVVDREWFQRTLRWLVEWVPETELTLVAALGRIARATFSCGCVASIHPIHNAHERHRRSATEQRS